MKTTVDTSILGWNLHSYRRMILSSPRWGRKILYDEYWIAQ
jgi:hypothetical protein